MSEFDFSKINALKDQLASVNSKIGSLGRQPEPNTNSNYDRYREDRSLQN